MGRGAARETANITAGEGSEEEAKVKPRREKGDSRSIAQAVGGKTPLKLRKRTQKRPSKKSAQKKTAWRQVR